MKVGIFLSPFWKYGGMRDLDEICKFVSSIGYKCVELSGKYHYNCPKKCLEKVNEISSILKKYGLEATGISYHVNGLHPDPKIRGEIIRNSKYLIEAAGELEIACLNGGSGTPMEYSKLYPGFYSDKEKVDEAWEDFRSVYGDLTDFAKDHSVKVCVEVYGYAGAFGVHNLVYNVKTVDKMFKVLPTRTLGLNYDPSHILWQQYDYVELIRRFGDRIYHTHIKDMTIYWDRIREQGIMGFNEHKPWRFRLVGFGQIEWDRVIYALKNVGYDGVLSLENEDAGIDQKLGAEIGFKILSAFAML